MGVVYRCSVREAAPQGTRGVPDLASKPRRPRPHFVTRIPRAVLFSRPTVSRTLPPEGNEPSPIPMMLVGR